MEKSNLARVLNYFVNALGVPVTRQSIIDELHKHPDPSSLLAISDLLNNWRVSNAAYQLTFEELIVAEVSTPFIAYVSNKEFVLVNHLNDRYSMVSNERWNKHRLTTDEFKSIYSGSILIANREVNSGEADYAKKRRKQFANDTQLPFVIATSVIILLASLLLDSNYLKSFSWQVGLLTLFKTIGLLIAILLLVQTIDHNNPLIQKLCGGDNNKNCNAVLSSKAAKISDQLSWSEVGLFYFGGTWLVLLFNSSNIQVLQMLAFFNLMCLPYTFYSIYHQWRIAKQWCVLCCAVQGLLWLEFFAFFPSLTQTIQFPGLTVCANFLIDMFIPAIAWVFIKPHLLLSDQLQPLKQQLHRFKYNIELFKKMLSEEVQYALPDENHALILGNHEAEHIITIVSNPYCQPCATAHKSLDEWLDTRDDIKLQVIFSTQTNDETDYKSQVAAHLLRMYADRNNLTLKRAIKDWYEQKQKNYHDWAKEHPLNNKRDVSDMLDKQREWCVLTEVTGTPTIFINGRKLPRTYQPEDIKYFI